jgi:glyoxylase-like metal-dependent hydrolase (beta-lactamase superfamily II)
VKKRNRLYLILGITFLALWAAYVVLFGVVSTPSTCAFNFDVGQARLLAASYEGEKATEIHAESLVTFIFPHRAVRGGAPWETIEMTVFAYQLRFPDRTIMLDSGMNEKQAEAAHGERYDHEAWKRILDALEHASTVFVSHEHSDHLGGLLETPAAYKNARLTPEQLNPGFRAEPAVVTPEIKAALKPLVYERMVAVAPGLVLIKAPGHTPGSQWFFVTKADGTEILFTGDTAWQHDNIDEVQGPPRMVSLMLKNDRDNNACQLAALHKLHETDPKIVIVPGHDGGVVRALETSGVLIPKF